MDIACIDVRVLEQPRASNVETQLLPGIGVLVARQNGKVSRSAGYGRASVRVFLPNEVNYSMRVSFQEKDACSRKYGSQGVMGHTRRILT